LELLSACWERIAELPEDLLEQMHHYFGASDAGYKILAGALPKAEGKSRPKWLSMPTAPAKKKGSEKLMTIRTPDTGVIDLIEEPLEPDTLEQILAAACADTSTTHWVAVKNLEAALRKMKIPKEVTVLLPPFLLPDPDATGALTKQSEFTADEATLSVKLKWYKPATRGGLPLHGDEKAIWSGKLAATETADVYTSQFEKLTSVVLVDHWQMLDFLADPDHAAHGVLSEKSHIIVDDASMLEDTASRAYGWYCSLNDLYAATQGNDTLTKFVDLLQVWIEKTRQVQDVRYITPSDLTTPDVKGLRTQLADVLTTDLPPRLQKQLQDLDNILTLSNLNGRITYIEQRMDSYPVLSSAPERIAPLLKEYLYGKYPVTLLVPAKSKETLQPIVPLEVLKHSTVQDQQYGNVRLSFDAQDMQSLLQNPPSGKTVILMSGKRSIEDAYVKYVEPLEEKGIMLICQGLSGGQGRMQAEFLASKEPTVWVMTPWMFEGLELDAKSIDHLVLQALPFDHPSHPVLSMRADQYQDPFQQYSLVRLEHRLFRLLRTFKRFASADADVKVLDDRLHTKAYGKRLLAYLQQFQTDEEVQQTLFD